jgi:hypothetical protein
LACVKLVMRGDMNHSTWIKRQFDKKRKTACYRDVLIHTSFVETIVKREALLKSPKRKQMQQQKKKEQRIGFEKAIGVLRKTGYDANAMSKIDQLRDKRNTIIHNLLKEVKLDDKLIKATLREMRELLKWIYHHVQFVQAYFLREYQIDTRAF